MAAIIAPFLVALGLMLIKVGHWLAQGQVASERADLAAQRQALDVEWEAVDAAWEVHGVYRSAEQAMQAEAQRAARIRQLEAGSSDQRGRV